VKGHNKNFSVVCAPSPTFKFVPAPLIEHTLRIVVIHAVGLHEKKTTDVAKCDIY